MGFFDARQAPAVVKHGLLRRYCPAFVGKAGKRAGGRVTFLDGYAGAGYYDDESPGSPLILMEALGDAPATRQVSAIFIEQDADTYQQLSRALRDRHPDGDYVSLLGDIDDHLERVLFQCRDRALFAFLDPFGPALARDRLCELLTRRARSGMPTDVLVHVSVRTVWNFASRLTNATRTGHGLSPQDQQLLAQLDRFLGPDWWRAEFERAGALSAVDDDTGEAERLAAIALRVAGEYARQVAAETGMHTVSMPVRRRPHHAPIFVLTLFTQHPEGAWLFADCIGKAGLDWQEAWRDEDFRRDGPSGTLALFAAAEGVAPFDRDQYQREHREEWISTIAGNVDTLLSQHQPLILQHHVPAVFGATLGAGAGESHARAAIKRLHKQGRVDHDGTGRFHREPMLRPDATRPGPGPARAG